MLKPCLVLLAAGAIAGCSSQVSGSPMSTPPSAAPATSTAPTTTSVKVVSAETIRACRGLADDKQLAKFWKEVSNGATSMSTFIVDGAIFAVQRLELPAADPLVETSVAAAMRGAAEAAAKMRKEWAASARFNATAFRDVITPVVDACQAQGIDMAVL